MIADPDAIPMQPLPNGLPSGVIGSDEILGHVRDAFDSMHPAAQGAVYHAHGVLGLEPPANAIANAPEPGSTPSIAIPASIPPATPPVASGGDSALPGMVGVNAGMLAAPPMPSNSPQAIPNPQAQPETSENGETALAPSPTSAAISAKPSKAAELQTLRDSGSGVSQIHNPFLKTLGTIGDVIGSGLFPGLTQFIPGSSAHHQMLVANKEAEVADEQKQQKAADTSRLQHAQAVEQESLPELNKTKAELAVEKLTSANNAKDADRAIKQAEEDRRKGEGQQKITDDLAKHGFEIDPETKTLRPLPYERMSQEQQAVHDLKASQSELADARSALAQAQKDNIPKAQEMALARIRTAQQNANTAAGRLGISRDQFNAQFLGTAPGGAPLAGGETDESGHPIGTKIAAANKPGATAQGRASQAESIIEAGNNLKAEIDKHRDKMGNLGSYWNQFANGSPIADPDAARLMSEIASYAALQPAMHGMRGGQVMKEFEKMVGGIPKNPDAMKAAIDGIASTASVMAKQGQPHNQQHSTTVAPPSHESPVVRKFNPATGKLE